MVKSFLFVIVLLAISFSSYAIEPPPAQLNDKDQQLLDQISLSEVQQILSEQSLPTETAITDSIDDQFGDVDLNDVLTDFNTGHEQTLDVESQQLPTKMLGKIAKPLEPQQPMLKPVEPIEQGVGIKGEQEAILNQLDNSNLMDYKVPPKIMEKLESLPEDEGVDPP